MLPVPLGGQGWKLGLVDEDPTAVEARKDLPGDDDGHARRYPVEDDVLGGLVTVGAEQQRGSGRALWDEDRDVGPDGVQGRGVGDHDVDVRGPAQVELDAGPHGEASGRVDAGQATYVVHVAVLETLGRQADVGSYRLAHRVLQSGPHGGGHHG